MYIYLLLASEREPMMVKDSKSPQGQRGGGGPPRDPRTGRLGPALSAKTSEDR